MSSYVSTLPRHVQWKILSFLPYNVLSKLQLSNKQTWSVLNARRRRISQEEWNEQVDWINKLMDVVLPVSDHLFLFTLSDLHYHTQITSHQCSYFTVPVKTKFELVPLQHVEQPSLEGFLGFMFKNANCSQIPWNTYKKLRGENTRRFSYKFVPRSSPVYTFLERELAHDQHIQVIFDSWRDWVSNEEDGVLRNIEDHVCKFCDDFEHGSSDSEYTPSNDYCDVSDTDYLGIFYTNMDMSVSEFEGLRDDYQQMVVEHEKTRREKHRQKVDKSMESSLQKWERGSISSDEYEYNYLSDSVYRKRKSRLVPPNEEVRKRYCNSFNNSGYCTHGLNCWFRHEKAPVCKYDINCKGVNCGFYHNPKPDVKMAKQLEDMESSIAELKEKEKMKEMTTTVNDKGEYEVQMEDVDVVSTDFDSDFDVNLTDSDFNSDDVDVNTVVDVKSADVNINSADNVCINSSDIDVNSADSGINTADFVNSAASVRINPADVVIASAENADINPSYVDVDSFDVDGNSSDEDEYTDDEILWMEFLKSQAKSQEDFNKEDVNERWKMKQVYIKNHGPFPRNWYTKIPDNNGFPLLFFLSEHPVNMDMVCLRNKQEIENLFVWDVYEMKENNHTTTKTTTTTSTTIFLGFAILTLNPYHRIDHAPDEMPPANYAFGDETLMAVGTIEGGGELYLDGMVARKFFWRSFKELPRIPSYCSWVDEISNDNDTSSDRDDSDTSIDDDDDEFSTDRDSRETSVMALHACQTH